MGPDKKHQGTEIDKLSNEDLLKLTLKPLADGRTLATDSNLVTSDKFWASIGGPYISVFTEDELEEMLDDFLDVIESVMTHPIGISTETLHRAGGQRRNANILLTNLEIQYIRIEIAAIEADTTNDYGEDLFVFNDEDIECTGYDSTTDTIYIKGDVFPDYNSNNPYDLVSVRAVLAHEHWGHRFLYRFYPNQVGPKGSDSDESLASFSAAKESPGLRKFDKEQLLRDSVHRARGLKSDAKVNFIEKHRFYDRIDQKMMDKLKKGEIL